MGMQAKAWAKYEIEKIAQKVVEEAGGGTTVVANPEGEATASLSKLQVDETVYGIPTPTTVVANPEGEATVDLSKLQVGTTIYGLPNLSTRNVRLGYIDNNNLTSKPHIAFYLFTDAGSPSIESNFKYYNNKNAPCSGCVSVDGTTYNAVYFNYSSSGFKIYYYDSTNHLSYVSLSMNELNNSFSSTSLISIV